MLAPLDGSVRRIAYSEYARINNYREHAGLQEYSSAVMFAYMGAEIKSPPGNGPYCFRT